MRMIIIVLIAMILSGCAGYKPSHDLLIKKGFIVHHPGTSKIFDVYTYKCNDDVFNVITYNPALRSWALFAGRDGYTLSIVQFTVDSEKELNLLLQDFNYKHQPLKK
ncbi:MAG: hypothetical protein ACOYM0_01380 [Bacteroidales bacterium]